MKTMKKIAAAVAICVSAMLAGGCTMQEKQAETEAAVQAEILEETGNEGTAEAAEAEENVKTEGNMETEEIMEGILDEEVAVDESEALTIANGSDADSVAEADLTIVDLSDFPTAAPDLIAIDYVDYEDGMVSVCFKSRAIWSEPIVLVRDEAGKSYPTKVEMFSAEGCTIRVGALESGKEYHFLLGGLNEKESKKATTLTGYFEKPEIAPGA